MVIEISEVGISVCEGRISVSGKKNGCSGKKFVAGGSGRAQFNKGAGVPSPKNRANNPRAEQKAPYAAKITGPLVRWDVKN
jgi:hypothetical protein